MTQYANERAMTPAMTPARTQTTRDAGPTSRAPIAVATYTSAPMIAPTTRFVTSKVFSRRIVSPVRTPRQAARRSPGPGDAQVVPDLLQLLRHLRTERDSFLAVRLRAGIALLSVHVDPILALGFRALFQLARESVHVPPELLERPERARVEGHEEMSDVGPLLVGVDLQPRRRAAQHAAQDVDHEGEPVAFVPAEVLALAAEREEAAAESGRERLQHPRGVRRTPSRLIDGPTGRDRLAEAVVDFHFAARHSRRRHIEDERFLLHRRRRQGDRVRAEDGDPAERRHDERRGGRHAHADEVVLERLECGVPCDPVVVRVPHRDDADGGVLRLPDRDVHPLLAHDLAEALSAIDERGRLRLLEDAALVARLHVARLQPADVPAESRDAVRVDPTEVREDQHVRRDARVLRRDAELYQDLFAEPAKGRLLDGGRLGHRSRLVGGPKNRRAYKLAVRRMRPLCNRSLRNPDTDRRPIREPGFVDFVYMKVD